MLELSTPVLSYRISIAALIAESGYGWPSRVSPLAVVWSAFHPLERPT